MQLLHEIQELENQTIKVLINHIKIHGMNTKKKDLTELERMHCVADRLAKSARTLSEQHSYLKLPINPVTLTINRKAINAHYSKHMSDACHSIKLCQYPQDKHSWSSPTIDNIRWRFHHLARAKQKESEQTILRKFNLDCWPTRYRDNKFYPHKASHCHSCLITTEREDHIICCHAESHKEIREKWLAKLLDFLSELHTPRSFRHCIYHHVEKWMEPLHKNNYEPIDPTIKLACQQQDAIGWRHFIRGRLSITWGTIINYHLAHNNITDTNAENWGEQIASLNWDYVLRLWNTRNQELHGVDKNEQEQRKKQYMISELRHIQHSIRTQ
jgi:hypothetical protein